MDTLRHIGEGIMRNLWAAAAIAGISFVKNKIQYSRVVRTTIGNPDISDAIFTGVGTVGALKAYEALGEHAAVQHV